ncbi:hypothetical protein GGR61_003946 [Xanthomonas arboricola]|nr:hypothetical protein [Xanthomonas sp. 3058]
MGASQKRGIGAAPHVVQGVSNAVGLAWRAGLSSSWRGGDVGTRLHPHVQMSHT